MSTVRVAMIGFGTVGQGFVRIVAERGEELRRRYGLEIRITAVSDLARGSVHDPAGLDPGALLRAVEGDGTLAAVDAPDVGWDALTTVARAQADVVAEVSYTDLTSGEPALTHVRAAIDRGLHVITTNKGPIALAGADLARRAAQRGVRLEAEGTVLSGTPVLHLATETLVGAGVTRMEGILNGTTNYVLGRMENGSSLADAVAEAQTHGYAEADPSGDIDGIDAAGKVVILANRVMDAGVGMADVTVQGIRGVTPGELQRAAEAGERIKLIGTVHRDGDRVQASVAPRAIGSDHPLASVDGAMNAVTFTTDLLGEVTLAGPGAGQLATGYALILDLLAIQRAKGGSS